MNEKIYYLLSDYEIVFGFFVECGTELTLYSFFGLILPFHEYFSLLTFTAELSIAIISHEIVPHSCQYLIFLLLLLPDAQYLLISFPIHIYIKIHTFHKLLKTLIQFSTNFFLIFDMFQLITVKDKLVLFVFFIQFQLFFALFQAMTVYIFLLLLFFYQLDLLHIELLLLAFWGRAGRHGGKLEWEILTFIGKSRRCKKLQVLNHRHFIVKLPIPRLLINFQLNTFSYIIFVMKYAKLPTFSFFRI